MNFNEVICFSIQYVLNAHSLVFKRNFTLYKLVDNTCEMSENSLLFYLQSIQCFGMLVLEKPYLMPCFKGQRNMYCHKGLFGLQAKTNQMWFISKTGTEIKRGCEFTRALCVCVHTFSPSAFQRPIFSMRIGEDTKIESLTDRNQ